MTFNIGSADRIARVVVGLLLVIAPFLSGLALFDSAAWSWGSLIVGAVLILTGIIRFCPAYKIIGFSSAQGNGRGEGGCRSCG